MKKLSNFLAPLNLPETSSEKTHEERIDLSFFRLQKDWNKIVGETIAERSIPLKIYQRSLILLTESPHFSQQISFMTSMIIEKIYTSIPKTKRLFTNVRFQSNPELFKRHRESPHKVAPANHLIDTSAPAYKRAILDGEKVFDNIVDLELKKILVDLYASSFSKADK